MDIMKTAALFLSAATCTMAAAEQEEGHTVLYWRGAGGYWSGKEWSATESGTKANWVADAIAVINSGNINFPQTGSLSVHKIRWNSSSFFLSAGAGELCLGSGGIELGKSMNFRSVNATKRLRLAESQTWCATGSTALSMNMNASGYLSGGNPIVLTAEDNVVLTLSGPLTWNFNVRTAFTNAEVHVVSPAKLAVTYYAAEGTEFNARTLVLDGSSSTLSSSAGAPCLMAGTLRLRNNGKLTVNSGLSVGVPLDGVAGRIVADEGSGTLSGVVAPATDGAAYPLEAAQGATLILDCTWKGVPRLRLSGAGTVIVAGAGSMPDIELADDFSGSVRVSRNAAFPVVPPAMIDISRISLDDGVSATARVCLPRAPVVYAGGTSFASGAVNESATNGWAFVFWDSVNDEAFGAQDAELCVSSGIVSVMPRNPPTELTCNSSKTWMDWSKEWFVDGSGHTTKWIDGAVVTLQNKNTTLYSNTTIGGLRWASFSLYFQAPGKAVHLGREGLAFTSSATFRFDAMSELRLVAAQTWTGVSGGDVYIGDNRSDFTSSYPRLFTADADANLSLSGYMSLRLNSPGDFSMADVTLCGDSDAGATTLYIDYSKFGDRSVTLNARTLTVAGRSAVYARTGARVDGGYAIARKLVLAPDAGNSPLVSLDVAADGSRPLFDVGSVETSESGTARISGVAMLPETAVPVSLAAGTTLDVSCAFANALARPGAFVLSGAGTWRASCATESAAVAFDAASVAGFSGAVRVAPGAVLNLSGAVDFPSLVFEGNAMVRLKLDRGDSISDMSKVTFPESGTLTFKLRRDDAIAAAEGSVDVGLDFSSVSSADRAKISIVVEDGMSGSPCSVVATPRFDGSGRLYADLSLTMSAKNGTFGGMLWIGREWADANDPQNWVVYPNGTPAANFDPTAHPSGAADARAKVSDLSVYCSAGWRLNLGGFTWSCPDGRNNDASDTPFAYGVSNGTWNASTLMLPTGAIDVESGAVFKANGYAVLQGKKYWYIGSGATRTSPFVFRVHDGGAADIGHATRDISAPLNNVRYAVDAGGSLAYYLKSPTFVNKARTVFENEGVLSFPRGFSLSNASLATTGAVAIVQNAGTLHLAGDFRLDLAEGAGSTCDIALAGGTAVVSNGATFAGWRFTVADGAQFAVEIPQGGDFSTDAFRWGAGATIEKRGKGDLRFAVTGSVASVGLKLSDGVLLPTGTNDVASVDVVFAGGALGADVSASGDAAEYGLVVTNGSVSGVCRVRMVGGRSGGATVPFLTIAESADPGYSTESVILEKRSGEVANGRVLRDEVQIGDVRCVRYSAEFSSIGYMIIVY